MAVSQAEAQGELVELLDQQVRARVRREGVDPQRDAPIVRRIAEGVVRDHDERGDTAQPVERGDPRAGRRGVCGTAHWHDGRLGHVPILQSK